MGLEERDGVISKRCCICKDWHPVSAFSRSSRTSDGYQTMCKPCSARLNREWRANNLERARQRERAYMEANREERTAYIRKYNEEHREERLAYIRAYDQEHREEKREKRRRYWQANPEIHEQHKQKNRERGRNNREQRREQQRRWHVANPDKVRAKVHRRRSWEHKAEGSFTAEEWEALKARYDYTCLCCGKQEPEIRLTVDHVIPVTRHGSNYITNIQPLCRSCNSSKRDKTIDYRPAWEAERGGE